MIKKVSITISDRNIFLTRLSLDSKVKWLIKNRIGIKTKIIYLFIKIGSKI